MRSSMLEVINQDYIRTARAKGAAASASCCIHHAIRNALLPMITIAGLQLPTLLERRAGHRDGLHLARHGPALPRFARAIATIPVVMGILMFSAVLVLIGNMLADMLYAVCDPRIRLD